MRGWRLLTVSPWSCFPEGFIRCFFQILPIITTQTPHIINSLTSMYTGFQHLHSYMSYLVLAGLVISIIMALKNYLTRQPFTDKDRKMALLGLIPTHLQWIFGLILYFLSPLGLSSLSGEAMSNSTLRLYSIEHPFTMILAVVLITIGFAKAKRGSDPKKQFMFIWAFYLLGLLLILIRIPWAAWP